MINEKNDFIIKQSDGNILHFFYMSNTGIAYRILRGNRWSSERFLVKSATNNFSVVQSNEDIIYLLYETLDGDIFFSVFTGWNFYDYQLYENKEKYKVYLDAAAVGNIIHLFFAVEHGDRYIVFQRIIDHNSVSPPMDIIHDLWIGAGTSFRLYTSKQEKLYFLYQCYSNNEYNLCYKVFDLKNKIWSQFELISKSSNPFKNFSLIEHDENIYAAYVEQTDEINILKCFCKNLNITFQEKIYENTSIDYCNLFTTGNTLWCTWLCNNEFLAAFTDTKQLNFSNSFYKEKLSSGSTTKAIYYSNFNEPDAMMKFNELYLFNTKIFYRRNLLNLVFCPHKNFNKLLNYCLFNVHKTYTGSADEYKDDIDLLTCELDEQKRKVEDYEKQINDMSNFYDHLATIWQKIHSNIKRLQHNYELKQKRIEILAKLLKEKQEELETLKKQH